MCPVLGFLTQEGYRWPWMSPVVGHQDCLAGAESTWIIRIIKHSTGHSERLWSILLGSFQGTVGKVLNNLIWIQCWPHFDPGVGLQTSWGSLPTWTILWFARRTVTNHSPLTNDWFSGHKCLNAVPDANTLMCRMLHLLQLSFLCCASEVPAYQRPSEITKQK